MALRTASDVRQHRQDRDGPTTTRLAGTGVGTAGVRVTVGSSLAWFPDLSDKTRLHQAHARARHLGGDLIRRKD